MAQTIELIQKDIVELQFKYALTERWLQIHESEVQQAVKMFRSKHPGAWNINVEDLGRKWHVQWEAQNGEHFDFVADKIFNRGPNGDEGFIAQEPIYILDDITQKFETKYCYLRHIRDELGISWQWVFDMIAKNLRKQNHMKDLLAQIDTQKCRLEYIEGLTKSEGTN